MHSIIKCNQIVHLDLSSNDITPEGARDLLELMTTHQSITSLHINSHEGLNRNRLGKIGAQPLQQLLAQNEVLSILNLQSTSLGASGLKYIIDGIKGNKSLFSLNLANNGLQPRIILKLLQGITNTNLKELDISNNKLGDEGAEFIAQYLGGMLGIMQLSKINLSSINITARGIMKIYNSLRTNRCLISINLSNNPLGIHGSFNVSPFLQDNITLKYLNLSNCDLQTDGVIAFGEGLAKNKGLQDINLGNNQILNEGAKQIAEGLFKNYVLKSIDLSSNKIGDEGGVFLTNSLRNNSSLQTLILKDNDLKDETGQQLSELTRVNKNLQTVVLKLNPINYKFIREIRSNLKSNRSYYQKTITPQLRSQVQVLHIEDDAIQKVYKRIDGKKKEYTDALERYSKQAEKVEDVRKHEETKFQFVIEEKVLVQQQNAKLDIELTELKHMQKMEEIRYHKEFQTLSDQIQNQAANIKQLEKKRSEIKQNYAMQRNNLLYQQEQLEANLKVTQEQKRMLQFNMESYLRKTDEMKRQIDRYEFAKSDDLLKSRRTASVDQLQSNKILPKKSKKKKRIKTVKK